MPKVSEYPEDTTLQDGDYLLGLDATDGKTKKIKVGTVRSGLALQGTTGGSGSTPVAQAAHGFVVGNVLYFTGSAYAKAKADTEATSYPVGVVAAVVDTGNFILQSIGNITGLSGLVAGTVYFLSDTTAGALVAYPPIKDGTVAVPVFEATSTTAGYVQIQRGRLNVNANTYSGLGINFGINSGGSFDPVYNNKWLQYLSRYIKKLRTTIPSWNDSAGIANARAIVLMAKDYGFETTYGVTAAGTGHNATYYAGWKTQVVTEAAWAAANGVDTFFIGNEEDWWVNQGGITGVTEATVRTDVLAFAVSLRASYPDMKYVYSTAEGEASNWDAQGIGTLDGFGMNLYNADFNGTIDYFKSLSFGGKMFLSEFNHNSPYPASGLTAQQYRDEITAKIKKLRSIGMIAYFFTFDWGGSYGTSTDWGLFNGDGTFKPGIPELFSVRS